MPKWLYILISPGYPTVQVLVVLDHHIWLWSNVYYGLLWSYFWILIQGLRSVHFHFVPSRFSLWVLCYSHLFLDPLIQGSFRSSVHFHSYHLGFGITNDKTFFLICLFICLFRFFSFYDFGILPGKILNMLS